MTAVMMRIMIPVTSPPRNAPTSVAVLDVGGSLVSCGPGVQVGLGCGSDVDVTLGRVSGVQKGLHTLTMVAV